MMQAIPSHDEIVKEFSHRAEKVRDRAEAERESEKSARQGNPEDRIRRSVVIADKTYISGDLTEQDLANPDVVKLTMKEYHP